MSDDPEAEHLALEATVLRSLKRAPWDGQLWFPVVQRAMLGFQSDAADEEIQAAILNLIQKKALVATAPYEWEVANLEERPGTDQSRDLISMPAESEARLREVLEPHGWVDELRPSVPKGLASPGEVTYLESQILLAIDHQGWFAHLWFPVVEHDYLNFGSHAPDDEVHRAILNMIRKGSLIAEHDEPGDRPNWLPHPEAFKTAVYKALGRKI